MNGLLNTTVVRVRPGTGADAYGNTVPDWTHPDLLELPARVQQDAWSEDTYDRDQQTARFVVFLPAGADVAGGDRLAWQGRTLEVSGPPAVRDGAAGAHHVECRAQEVVG